MDFDPLVVRKQPPMFNNKRLVLARRRRKLTAKHLSECSDISAKTITRLENGENEPDDPTVRRLCAALDYPIELFFRDDPETIDTGAVSFRSLTRMAAKDRDAAISAGTLGIELNGWVEERFSLPASNLPDLSHETDPETAAISLRQHWALGEKPIGNMVRLLETQGVRVFSLAEDTANVDAFSFWNDEKPFVFLNYFKTVERSIFDARTNLATWSCTNMVVRRRPDPQNVRQMRLRRRL